MGVLGLREFIERNWELRIRGFKLHDTTLIISGSNFVYRVAELSQRPNRNTRFDQVGGDLTVFAAKLRTFFKKLRDCKIKPIVVMGGAYKASRAPADLAAIQLKRKWRREERYFEQARGLVAQPLDRQQPFVIPRLAFSTFVSVALEFNVEIHQYMFSSISKELARLALEHDCPVVSDDTEDYLFDFPRGVISTFSLLWDAPQRAQYIECSLYMRARFTRYRPDLQVASLILLSITNANDLGPILDGFEAIQRFVDELANGRRRASSIVKLVRVIEFLRGKSLEENIDAICLEVGDQDGRLKEEIVEYLKKFEIPSENKFRDELEELCRDGFYADRANRDANGNALLEEDFEEAIGLLCNHLKIASEQSLLPLECFDLMHRNTLFTKSQVDDSSLEPSSNYWLRRAMRVILRLVRMSRTREQDNGPCEAYDRLGELYKKFELIPSEQLDPFGPLNLTIFDLPNLSLSERKNIILATFYMRRDEVTRELEGRGERLQEGHASEIVIIRLLMRFIDLESPSDERKLWPEFKLAVLLSMIYYFEQDEHFLENDQLILISKLRELANQVPRIMQAEQEFDSLIVYQITQLQATIFGYNSLNSLLLDACPRVEAGNWLNSCFIYSLTRELRRGNLEFDNNELPNFTMQVDF